LIVLLLSLSQRGQHLAVRREHISYQQRSRRIKTPSSPNSASLHPSPTTISPRDVDCSRVGQWEACKVHAVQCEGSALLMLYP
jgi:hypothetical protein